MLGSEPDLERRAWHALSNGASEIGDTAVERLVTVYAASRLLAVRRALAGTAPPLAELFREVAPAATAQELVPILEGVLYAYARDPARVDPPLLPYQVISLYEVLEVLGRQNARLRHSLVERLQDVLRAAPAEHVRAFNEWRGYSRLVEKVGAVPPAAPGAPAEPELPPGRSEPA
jgi:hypothetical protein